MQEVMELEFGPFQGWLKDKYKKYGTIDALCMATGLSQRKVECYLRGRRFDKRLKDPIIREISLDEVDRTLLNEWSTELRDVYPSLYS